MKLTLFWCLVITCFAFGQAGSVDTTFNESNFKFGTSAGITVPTASDMAVLSDGKIVITGRFSEYNGLQINGVMRIKPDGSIDSTFISGFQTPFGSDMLIDVQSDGKIILAGELLAGYTYNGVIIPNIIRINPDGSLDPTFNQGTGFTNPNGFSLKGLAVLSDDKIVVAGSFSAYNGVARNAVIRLNPDGTLDTGFGSSSSPLANNTWVKCMAVQPDGKVLIGGNFVTWAGYLSNGIVRLNNVGLYDSTFAIGSGLGEVRAIGIQPDSSILVSGQFTGYNGNNMGSLLRFHSDGSFDTTFQSLYNIETFEGNILSIACLSNGKIAICGDFNPLSLSDPIFEDIALLEANGSFASTTLLNATESGDILKELIALDNNKFLAIGEFQSINGYKKRGIVRFNPDCSVDVDFLPGNGVYGQMFSSIVNGAIYKMISQPDGKKIIAGHFSEYNGEKRKCIARIEIDGSLDTTFQTGIGATTDVTGELPTIYHAALQPDGKIIIAGNFRFYNGDTANYIIRLNSDGTVDNSFVTGSGYGPNAECNSLCLFQDGSIVVSGSFTSYNGTAKNKLARINPDGSLNNSLTYTLNGIPSGIYALSDNGMWVIRYGDMTHLNANGALISEISALYDVSDFAFDQNGNLLVVGNFPGPVRYLAGTSILDNSFNNTGINSSMIRIQPDGKIMVRRNGNRLIRLNADGTIDMSYDTTHIFGEFDYVADLLFENERLLACGSLLTYDNYFLGGIVALGTLAPSIPDLQIGFNIQNNACQSGMNVTAQGYYGNPPYTYEWNVLPANNDPQFTPDSSGIYECTVTDNLGENVQAQVYIFGPVNNNVQPELKVNLHAFSFRAGFPSSVWVEAFNDGCTAATGQLTVVIDTLLEYVDANPVPTSINGDTLIWDFSNMTYQSPHLTPQIRFNTPTYALIGDSVHFEVKVNPIVGDLDSSNNVRNYTFPIINGYDPNIKSAYPVGKCEPHYINQNQLLTYTIQFQNTGNSEAINIAVIDSLSSHLDLQTVRVVGNSHPMWTEVLPGNVLKFHFNNILLPDSTSNEPESHGYVIFEVSPLSSWINHNTEISNNADIYFDFNPPIRTNTVTHTIYHGGIPLEDYNCQGAGLASNNESFQLLVYPNPASESVTIALEDKTGTYDVILTDMQGRKLSQHTLNNGQLVLPIGELPDGVYLLTLSKEFDKQHTTTKRLIKQ